jgi:hypothetical protein
MDDKVHNNSEQNTDYEASHCGEEELKTSGTKPNNNCNLLCYPWNNMLCVTLSKKVM